MGPPSSATVTLNLLLSFTHHYFEYNIYVNGDAICILFFKQKFFPDDLNLIDTKITDIEARLGSSL